MRLARLLRTRHPVTFTEKVRYKMLRDRRELIVTFADKAAVRDYVASRVGAAYLPRAYAIVDDSAALESVDLPDAFVVKPTHGSGAAIVVSASAPAGAELPRAEWGWVYRHVAPGAADRRHLADIARVWLTKLYGQGPNREWAYGRVPRRVIVEELLEGSDGGIPPDLKFFMFHGRCRYIQVDAARFGSRTQDFFDPEWNHVPLSGGPRWADPTPARPGCLDEMLDVARRLSAETDFVRVDLYDLPDRVVFGELTSYPAGGESPFAPSRYDAEFGSHWTVPRRYV
ncbi:ATP-grasp fold amidoligase family protein [Marisediminicola sp. LYQ85]|uniref:ATP-grasp fold amidoligase family protein n=1 Tax=Marisediminicola sp. LYQ85 TaxID=3391062 RepID=UPI0039836871